MVCDENIGQNEGRVAVSWADDELWTAERETRWWVSLVASDSVAGGIAGSVDTARPADTAGAA